MATPTPFLGLYTIDLETEGSTKKVGAYLTNKVQLQTVMSLKLTMRLNKL